MTEHETNTTRDDWNDCPAGEIQQMVARERSRRTSRRLTRAVSATSVVAVLMIAVFVGGRRFLNQPGPAQDGGGTVAKILTAISCEEVVKYLPAYLNDTLHRDHPHAYSAVFVHVNHCPHCDAKKKELLRAQSAARFSNESLVRIEPPVAQFQAASISKQ